MVLGTRPASENALNQAKSWSAGTQEMRYHNFVGGAAMENNCFALYPMNFRSGSDSLLNVDRNVIIGGIPGVPVPGWDPFGHHALLLARLRSSFRPALGELAWSAQTNVNCSSQAINRFNGSYWFLDAYVNRTNNFGPPPANTLFTAITAPMVGMWNLFDTAPWGRVTATRIERIPGHDCGPLGCSAPTYFANNVDIRALHLGSYERLGRDRRQSRNLWVLDEALFQPLRCFRFGSVAADIRHGQASSPAWRRHSGRQRSTPHPARDYAAA